MKARKILITMAAIAFFSIAVGCPTTNASDGYATNEHPDNFQQGLACLYNYQYKQAIALLTRVIENDPTFFAAYLSRGQAYYETGKYQKAITDLTRAIELNPEKDGYLSYYSHWARGDSYRVLKQYKPAIADLSKAISLKNDSHTALYSRALAYTSIGQYLLAWTDCQKVLRLNDRYAKGYFLRAVLCEMRGRKADAIMAYNTFIQYGTDDHLKGLVQEARQRIEALQRT